MTEFTSIWGKPDYLVPRLSGSARIPVKATDDRVTVIFDDAFVKLDEKVDGREGTWTGGLVLPLDVTAGKRKIACHVRGFVTKTAGSCAVLVTNIAGHVETREFGYGTTAEGQELFFESNFDATPLTEGRVVITVLIHVERQKFDDNVTLALDTFDLTAS